jgi:hypothetical protein
MMMRMKYPFNTPLTSWLVPLIRQLKKGVQNCAANYRSCQTIVCRSYLTGPQTPINMWQLKRLFQYLGRQKK